MTYKIEYFNGEFVIDSFISDAKALDYYLADADDPDQIDFVLDIHEVDEDYNEIRRIY